MKKNATPKAIFCDRAREAKDLTWPPPGILARTTDIHRITASTTGIPLPPDRWQPLPEIRWAQSPRLQAVAEDVAVLNGLDMMCPPKVGHKQKHYVQTI